MYVSSADVKERERKKNTQVEPVAQEPSLKNVLLCRKTYVDPQNHTVYEGEFKTLVVGTLPNVVEELFVVTKWGDGSGDAFRQEIKIFDPSGSLEVFSSRYLEESFSLQSLYHEHMVIGRVSGILLPTEGRYRMEIYLDGRLKGKTFFNVALSRDEEAVFPYVNERTQEEPAHEHVSFPLPIPLPLPVRLSLNCLRFAKD